MSDPANTQSPSPADHDHDDGLGCVRGIRTAMIPSLLFWAGLIAAFLRWRG